MGRTAQPGPKGYHGREVGKYRAAVFAEKGTICHLCGREGADTVDHIVPRSVRPDLSFVVSNGRPAHKTCNSSRGKKAVAEAYAAPGW